MNQKTVLPSLILCLSLLAVATLAYYQNLLRPNIAPESSSVEYRDLTPPAPVMTVAGQMQTGGVGTFCWSDRRQGVSICADMVGIPTPVDALLLDGYAEKPFQAKFQLDDLAPISDLALYFYPVTPEDILTDVTDSPYTWWPFKENVLSIPLVPSHTATAEMTLSPGLYVFNLFAIWEGQGDGSFGFLIEIR
ncbi:MAG: hypothetical protein Fur0022_29200 [Anaerolineales bacterium]